MAETQVVREKVHFWLKVLVPVALVVLMFALWGSSVLDVLTPFVIAFLIAYIFSPVVDFIQGTERRRFTMPRLLAVILVYLLLIVLVLVFLLITARIIEEVILLASELPEYALKLYSIISGALLDTWKDLPAEYKNWIEDKLDPESPTGFYKGYIKPYLESADWGQGVTGAVKGLPRAMAIVSGLASNLYEKVIQSVGSIIGAISAFILVLVISFYLLLDFAALKAKIESLVPEYYRHDSVHIAHRIDRQISGFFRGQLLICVIMGIMVAVGMMLAGVEYALLIGLAAGVFNIIPYLGPIMGATPAVIVTILQEHQGPETDWKHMLLRLGIVASVFVIVQTLDGVIVSPKVMGNKMNLHPMIILFALLLGGALFGLFGMLVAVPAASVIRVLIQEIYFPGSQRKAA